MSDDVIVDVGPMIHLHWVDADGVVREPFAPGTLEVYVDGERCALCQPQSKREATLIIGAIGRGGGGESAQ